MDKLKIGVIFCGLNIENFIEKSLYPWISARGKRVSNSEIIISVVSKKFINFPQYEEEDNSINKLLNLQSLNNIKDVFYGGEPISEFQARDLCLQSLLKDNCDYIWQVDFDEEYSLENIENIINYIKKDSLIACYKISFKNYIFDEKTYLEEPFTPPRIYKTKIGSFKINRFYFDNDISYINENREEISYENIGIKTIPQNIAFVKHYSWLNNDTSRRKVEYHNKRGWTCSYKWSENKGLDFNPEYYIKHGKNIPKILKDK